MNLTMNEESRAREYAHARLKARHDLKVLAAVWAGVTALLVLVWSISDPAQPFWPLWPMLGVGIAVAVTAFKAYGPPIGLITERDIEAEVERLTRS
ncbi:2TM domain-containing protein [Naasia sp. SYSU D00948]|uniref:2TM domain-containing protein n=1 Tax=Naasia sp. SYSU D00948 TaxID=2817379 RepID=UPI001B31671A|nr:2TM domain-containing protein [Naasia sp. SYSU D00948]